MNGAEHKPLLPANSAAPANLPAPVCRRCERLLQISLALLTALGTLLLGMGERNVLLPVLAIIVAISSVYLTDVKGWLQLNTLVANVAGLIALAVTWREWNDYAAEGQLLSLANLLIYLQFVLLYRRKTIRNYWLLLLLSLLQVAVAAALNMSVSFGVLLPAYMFVGLVTMALFVIHRAQTDHMAESGGETKPDWPPQSRRRWPLAGSLPAFEAVESPGAASAGLGWTLFRQIIWLGMAACLFALVWFLGLPRPGKKAPWRPSGVVPYTSVGFSETVTLGQLGEVYENPEEVMQVSFRSAKTSEPYRVGGDSALLRGSVLYDYHRGRWQPLQQLRPKQGLLLPIPDDTLPRYEDLVIEQVSIKARNDNVLFSVVPAFAIRTVTKSHGLEYSQEADQFLRPGIPERPYQYELATTAFKGHVPVMQFAAQMKPSAKLLEAALEMPLNADDTDPLEGLRAAAAKFTNINPNANPEQKARYLENFLRASGEFKYSLRQQPRSLGVDAVEAFVTDHHTGHCEYFASALVLMLRSQDIPARLAIGFKGGEYNLVGQYYQIRELHAHAWVEAYMPPDALPPGLANDPLARENGAWLILDPTPGRTDVEFSDAFGLGPIKRLLDLTQLIWTNYVLGLDSQRQQEVIYQPLLSRLEDALRGLADEEARERFQQALSDLFRHRLGLEHGLFSWQGFLVSTVALLLLAGLWKLAATFVAFVRGRLHKRPHRKSRTGHHVEFYEQFESLLARYGMSRTASQTPREFALATGGYLAESPLTQPTAVFPKRIVDAFYLIRFGRHDLDADELQSIRQAVTDLSAALEKRRTG